MKRGFTLIEVLVVVAVIGILIALLLPAVQQARSSARRTQCLNNLKQIGLATHNYHDTHLTLPPGAMLVGPSFAPASGWGWGAMLLPWLEQRALHDEIDYRIGTASGSNIPLIAQRIAVWRCPADSGPEAVDIVVPGSGSFRVAHGNYAANEEAMGGLSSVRFQDILDGLSNTALASERAWNPDASLHTYTSAWPGIIATESQNVFDAVPYIEMLSDRPINFFMGGSDCFSSYHSGGAHIVLGDGSVRFFSENMDAGVYEALGTIAGSDKVSF